MAKIRVFHPGANPAVDNPAYYISRKIADELLSNRRARRVSSIAIQLAAISMEVGREVVAAAGYDQAVHRDPQKNFNDAWQKCSSAGVQILQMYPFRRQDSVSA